MVVVRWDATANWHDSREPVYAWQGSGSGGGTMQLDMTSMRRIPPEGAFEERDF